MLSILPKSTLSSKMPEWADKIANLSKMGVHNMFVLHTNVRDFTRVNGHFGSLSESLFEMFKHKSLVISFNIGGGISFPLSGHENLFRELTGLKAPEMSEEERRRLNDPRNRQALKELGADGYGQDPPLPFLAKEVVPLLEKVMKSEDKRIKNGIAIVIDYAEFITPAAEPASMKDDDRIILVMFQRWVNESWMKDRGHVAIFISANLEEVNRSIRSANVATFEVPMPDFHEREDYVGLVLEQTKAVCELSKTQFAQLSAGLNRQQIYNLCLQSSGEGKKITAQVLKEKKRDIFDSQYSGLIEIKDPKFGFSAIGGLKPVVARMREIIKALAAGQTSMVPKGLMFIGPPGTGKSTLAEAMAFEADFNFATIVNPRTMFVGQSEQRYWSALQAIKALAPIVVLEDEADQSEQSRDEWVGDSGVSNRIRQMRFEFTADPKNHGKILWVRISNRPDKLDPADKRPGRSSLRIPLLMPRTELDKIQILEVMPKIHNFETDVNFKKVAEVMTQTHGPVMSGADMEEISLRAYQHSQRRFGKKVELADYEWAVKDYMPLNDPKKIAFMEREAVLACSSREFLPEGFSLSSC